MSMWNFWSAALLFHGLLGAATVLILRRHQPSKVQARRPPRARDLLIDAVRFGNALILAALLAGILTTNSFFAVARFLCQGVFGEGILFSLSYAALALRNRWSLGVACSALTGALLLMIYVEAYRIGPRNLRIRLHVVDRSGANEAPRRLRILHLSDLQTDRIGTYEERVFREAAALKPDLTVFTGDYIQERIAPTHRQASLDLRNLVLRSPLRTPLGFYAMEGDMDGIGTDRDPAVIEITDWHFPFHGTPVRPLWNEAVRISLPGSGTMRLVGLGCDSSREPVGTRVSQLLNEGRPEEILIVAGHAPDFAIHLNGRDVDLALAGHTHGGQVVLPFVGPPITLSRLPRRYAGGLNDYEGTPLHVSRGIGMERSVAPQIRFRCPPEICLIELRY